MSPFLKDTFSPFPVNLELPDHDFHKLKILNISLALKYQLPRFPLVCITYLPEKIISSVTREKKIPD